MIFKYNDTIITNSLQGKKKFFEVSRLSDKNFFQDILTTRKKETKIRLSNFFYFIFYCNVLCYVSKHMIDSLIPFFFFRFFFSKAISIVVEKNQTKNQYTRSRCHFLKVGSDAKGFMSFLLHHLISRDVNQNEDVIIIVYHYVL